MGVWSDTAYNGHAYCHNTVNPATGDEYYRLSGAGPIWKRDGTTGAWTTFAGPNVGSFAATAAAIEWFPEGNVLMYCGRTLCFTYDGATWTQRGSGLAIGTNHAVAQYSKANGCVYFGGGNTDVNGGLYRLNSNLTITTLANPSTVGINWAVATTLSVIEPVTGDLLVSKQYFSGDARTWYRFYDDGSNGGLGQWAEYAMGTGKPSLPIYDFGCATFSLDAPYNCMVFLRYSTTAPDMWIYKD
jgi:hypothetical protein